MHHGRAKENNQPLVYQLFEDDNYSTSMDSSDEEEERELQRRRAAQKSQQNGSARRTNLNEALAKALSNGFPGDTQCDIIVTAEELKKEEDEKQGVNGNQENGGSKEKDVAMDEAEEKTGETLFQIRSESKVEPEDHAMSRQDDEGVDSDDDMEAYRIQQSMASTDIRALDSAGSSVFTFFSTSNLFELFPFLS